LTLSADNGDTLALTGASLTAGIGAATAVVDAAAFGSAQCLSPFAAGTFSGQIVICKRGVNARVAKSFNVAAGGASGMILYNPTLQGLATDNHFIPTVHLENVDGSSLLGFMSSHTGVTATFTPGTATVTQGDVMAAFSSRGGPGQTLGISKPDVTAPGVQILAGHTSMPATINGGPPGELFQAIQGTSMSSPHVAGAAALLKDLHPGWTPGQIKSVLMGSAVNTGVTKEDGVTPADPFDDGSGRISLTAAGKLSLTLDETGANYIALEDELFKANYPSLYVPVMPGRMTVQRTVHNTTGSDIHVMDIKIETPSDLRVTVGPRGLVIPANGDADLSITVDARDIPLGEVRHAAATLGLGGPRFRFPIAIIRQAQPVTMDKTCSPGTVAVGGTVSCTITLTNNSFEAASMDVTDQLPPQWSMVAGSLTGASPRGNTLVASEILDAAEPPGVTASSGSAPFGYVALAPFGVPAVSGAGDETIHNFSLPAFVYHGNTYTTIGMVSNGYLIPGGGTGGDVSFINQSFPNSAQPNNVLAPFWTDLNTSAGGAQRAAILTSGTNKWVVFEWSAVRNYNGTGTNSFQVWIGLNGVEDISYVYGSVLTAGNLGFLTVGAENQYGNRGSNFYYNGTGTLPVAGFNGVDVTSTPAQPGGSHVISFNAEAKQAGPWKNCTILNSSAFFGTEIDCASGVTQ